jgi:hypothetical protein
MAHPTRIFKEPIELLNVFNEYKANLKQQSNEWIKTEFVGKDGTRTEVEQKVPMTIEGFKRFCREKYGEVEQYFTNQDKYYNDFIGICRGIKEEIRENQIIGGMLGFYNPSITQRLNNLKESIEQTVTTTNILSFDPLDDSSDNSIKKD